MTRTRIAVGIAATNMTLFALMSLAHWAAWGGPEMDGTALGGTLRAVAEGLAITAINLGFGLLVIAATFALRPFSRTWPVSILIISVAAVALGAARALALAAFWSTPTGDAYAATEWFVGAAAAVVAVGSALLTAVLLDRARTEEKRREVEEHRAARAVDELQAEETRVRRMIADELHGSLQHRLVTVTAGLDRIVADLAGQGHGKLADDVRHCAEELEEIREDDVRSLSHAIFPSGADLGTIRAIEAMLRRLPPAVATSIDVGPAYQRLAAADTSPMPIAERLVAVYTVEEAVTNALKHGGARSIQVHVDAHRASGARRWVLDVTVDDDGSGPPHPNPPLHGLERHRSRIENRGGVLDLTTNPGGGGRLHFTLPFERDGATTRRAAATGAGA